jgi:hypothetical protein
MEDSLAADAPRVVPAIAPFASPAKRHIFGVVARLAAYAKASARPRA